MARLLLLVATADRRGAEVFAGDLASQLDDRGHDCRLMALAPASTEAALRYQVAGRARWDPVGLARIVRAARESDLVVGNGSSTLIGGAIASSIARKPFIYRGIGDPAAWGDVRFSDRRIGTPLRHARGVVALYDEAATTLTTRYRLDPERVRVIPNGADETHFSPVSAAERKAARDALGLMPGLRWSALVGALSPEKRPELAVHAVLTRPSLGLLVAGDGPLAADLQRLGAAAPERIRLCGAVEDVRPILAAADAVVITSRTEGIPAIAIEAGLRGIPVVATGVGGLPEVIEDGRTGLIIAVDSGAAAIAAALDEAYERREELGGRAITRCRERYALAAIGESWATLVEHVMSETRTTRGT